jgi:hypothetical protein
MSEDTDKKEMLSGINIFVAPRWHQVNSAETVVVWRVTRDTHAFAYITYFFVAALLIGQTMVPNITVVHLVVHPQ